MELIEQKNELLDIDINEKDKSNFKNISYSKRDIYYRKAKEEGFRARSVYKLKEINDNYKILEGANKILDLCAAPGSWSQMLRILTKNNSEAKIVSVDLQEIVPIEGVILIKGDITKQETIKKILHEFANEKVDIVICDGAPDLSGLVDVDMYMQVQLMIFALVICLKVLKPGGKFVSKIFKEKKTEKIKINESFQYGAKDNTLQSDFYYEKFKLLFDNVYYYKPSSSRSTSNETFAICEGFGIGDTSIEEIIEKLTIEELINFKNEKIENIEFNNFLNFLCDSDYN